MARRAGIVEVRHAVLHQPHGAVLQLRLGALQRFDELFQVGVVFVIVHEVVDLVEEREDGAAAIGAELAADEIERLDAVGAFVDHGDARIAHELAHAMFFDVAVAAEDLLAIGGVRRSPCR